MTAPTYDLTRVYNLAAKLGATIHTSEPNMDRARATPWSREVFVATPEIAGEGNWFWTVLHELGHIANQHMGSGLMVMLAGSAGVQRVADQEAQAWAWALDNAGRPLDAEGRALIASTLPSYLQTPLDYRGENLTRVFSEVGPNPDVDRMARLEPRHFRLAFDIWQRYYPSLAGDELAVAA